MEKRRAAATLLYWVFCLCLFLESARCSRKPLLRIPRGVAKTGNYIVVLYPDASEDKLQETMTAVSKVADGGKIFSQAHTVAKAFTTKLSPYSLEAVRLLPAVYYMEEEGFAEGVQAGAEWHLDRLDQKSPELDGLYFPIGDGSGADIYIMDSGINYDHEEFEYRAKYVGRDPIDDYHVENDLKEKLQRGRDCNGHGTHVASLSGGKTYGSAKKARLFSVRVLNCFSNGPWGAVIAGLDIVADQAQKTNRPSIVSMSLTGSFNRATNDAVTKLVNQGVHVIVAAGNGKKDTCRHTPASNSLAITVGGSRRGDGLYLLGVGSNFGSCVDIFAPGEEVRAADYSCNNCSIVFSGTSMATPLVSGLAAVKLTREPLISPRDLEREFIDESLKNVLDFSGIPSAFRSNTVNRLVTFPGSCGLRNYTDGTGQFSSPNFPGLYPPNLDCRWQLGGQESIRVEATIAFLELEHSYDRLWVYDGCCGDSSNIVGNLTGSLGFVNLTFNSTGNLLCIQLITDATTSGRGFNGTFVKYYQGTNLKVPTATLARTVVGAVDVQAHLLIPPRQARSLMSNLMKTGYKLTWISSYRVGPDMIPYFDFVVTNNSAVDTVSFVEINFRDLNETIYAMEGQKYYVSLLIDRIRGKNPTEPTYSVIFARRDEIFETKVYLRDSLVTYKTRLAQKTKEGFRLLSQSFCSIRGHIEVSSVFVRDRRIPYNIPTPVYPKWRAKVNLTFFQFTDETLKEARADFIPAAVEVYKVDGVRHSMFSVVYEERTRTTEGNWFRWSLNSTAARQFITDNTGEDGSWDIYISSAYTYLGRTEHFIEFTRKYKYLN